MVIHSSKRGENFPWNYTFIQFGLDTIYNISIFNEVEKG